MNNKTHGYRFVTTRVLTRTEVEQVRVLIAHALEDMSYGGGGTYSIDPGGEARADERVIKKAKLGIATVARLLEELQ